MLLSPQPSSGSVGSVYDSGRTDSEGYLDDFSDLGLRSAAQACFLDVPVQTVVAIEREGCGHRNEFSGLAIQRLLFVREDVLVEREVMLPRAVAEQRIRPFGRICVYV